MNWDEIVKKSSEAEIVEMLTGLFCTAETLKEINEDYKKIIKAFLDGNLNDALLDVNVCDEVRDAVYAIVNAKGDD